MNWFQRLGRSGSDRLVQIASGEQPIRILDESHSAFRVIMAVAIVAFGASGWLLWHTISTAAKLPPLKNTATASINPDLAVLKTRDTDGDGLNDYDELYQYHSSPYLFSSASDGISDGVKVAKGENPNCPEGKSCSVSSGTQTTTNSSTTTTVEFLRQALKTAGAPAATVDQADDATILRMYQQVANTNPSSTNTSTANGNNNTNSSALPTTADLSGLTPTQIRTLLAENGIDATTLNSVDDKTLQTIFQQALNTNSN